MIIQTKEAIENLKLSGFQRDDFIVQTPFTRKGSQEPQITIFDTQKAFKKTRKLLKHGFNVTHVVSGKKIWAVLVKVSYDYQEDGKLKTTLQRWDSSKRIIKTIKVVKEVERG